MRCECGADFNRAEFNAFVTHRCPWADYRNENGDHPPADWEPTGARPYWFIDDRDGRVYEVGTGVGEGPGLVAVFEDAKLARRAVRLFNAGVTV